MIKVVSKGVASDPHDLNGVGSVQGVGGGHAEAAAVAALTPAAADDIFTTRQKESEAGRPTGWYRSATIHK